MRNEKCQIENFLFSDVATRPPHLTGGLMAIQAVVRTGNLAFERWARGDCFVVADVAVRVVGNFVGQLSRDSLAGVSN